MRVQIPIIASRSDVFKEAPSVSREFCTDEETDEAGGEREGEGRGGERGKVHEKKCIIFT